MKSPLPMGTAPLPLLEEDIIEAMRTLPGYLPITPSDFGELYQVVYGMVKQRLATTTTAAAIMRTPALTLPEGATMAEALALFAAEGISGAPVVNAEGCICGVLSEKDILRSLNRPNLVRSMQLLVSGGICAHELEEAGKKRVGSIMASPAVVAEETATLGDVVRIFNERAIHRLPIVNSSQRPTGIITRTDLFATFAILLQ